MRQGKNLYARQQSSLYRLRQNVRFSDHGDEVCLTSSFPLKTIAIHPCWSSVFKQLSTGEFRAFDDIVSMLDSGQPDPIEWFLNDLVRKGFLEQKGVRPILDYPVVSIIVPVRNRPADLHECLESLTMLDYPEDKFEIIVVDDASTDHTPEVADRFPVSVIRLVQNRKAPYCRNLAARQARGDILAFIDSDCLANRRWLLDLVPAFNDPAIGAVGGKIDNHYNASLLDRYEKVRSSLDMGARPKRSTPINPFFYVPSCNLLVRRDFFLNIGGFNHDLVVGEDVDLCWRIQDSKKHIEYRPVGTVYHKHRNRLRSFCARRFDYGTSEPLLQRLHPGRRKFVVFSVWAVLAGLLAIACLVLHSSALLAVCASVIGVQTLGKYCKVRRQCAGIGFFAVMAAVFRTNSAFLYQYCSFVSRYYLVYAVPLVWPFPSAAATIAAIHLLTAVVEYIIRKPDLNPLGFIIYFTLEQLSYQAGVWYECFRNLSFYAVNPKIIGKRLEEV